MEYPATAATVETLPNGLTLILDPDPAAPVGAGVVDTPARTVLHGN